MLHTTKFNSFIILRLLHNEIRGCINLNTYRRNGREYFDGDILLIIKLIDALNKKFWGTFEPPHFNEHQNFMFESLIRFVYFSLVSILSGKVTLFVNSYCK